jgi:DNA repair exonuclease SbcCD nuclease subunit
MLKEAGLPVFFVPGEHDMLDPDGGKAFLNRFGKGSRALAGTASTIAACTSSRWSMSPT